MPGGRLTFSALCGALLFPLLVPALQCAAQADVYHAVAAGDTLASIAAKYRVSVEQLRATNGLKEGDRAPLGAMLIRVPGTDKTGTDKNNVPGVAALAPSLSNAVESGFGNSTFSATLRSNSGVGSIAKTLLETVRNGDSWEEIAARYNAAGYSVSVDDLRRRNNWSNLPAPGQTVVVPLSQTTYLAPATNSYTPSYAPAPRVAANPGWNRPSISASAQAVPQSQTNFSSMAPRALAGGVLASGEIDLPFAQDNTPTQPPVFGAAPPLSSTKSAPPRRGSLPSRGGYGVLARGAMSGAMGSEVRILSPNEEASAPPASSARIKTNAAAARASSVARVARVMGTGARIRRLPQASAVTLYKCAVGTQLAVLRQNGAWSAVLMSDRSTGWLPSKYLALTPQSVDVSAQITSSDPGGSVNDYNGDYAAESPMVAQALRWLGTPYRYGGTSRRGIDCSSLVQHAFAACGYGLPRTAAQQARVGSAIAPASLRAGDRLYFSASGSRIDHTGLYMGDGLFVHASGSGRQVMVSNLFTPRNWNIFVGARR